MRIVITPTVDWMKFNEKLVDTLFDRGINFRIYRDENKMRMSLVVPEWVDFLRILWHVWAEFSRVSDYGRFFRMRYEVAVWLGDKQYNVGIRITPNGLVYGSIAL